MHVIALIENTGGKTWHPVLFRPAPMPGDSSVPRYRSAGHHTSGFATRTEAEDEMNRMMEKLPGSKIVDDVYQWNGDGVPAMTSFFPND